MTSLMTSLMTHCVSNTGLCVKFQTTQNEYIPEILISHCFSFAVSPPPPSFLLNTIQAYRGNILSQTIDFFKNHCCQKCNLIKHINVYYEKYFSFARPKLLLFANNKEIQRYTWRSALKNGPAQTWRQVTNVFPLSKIQQEMLREHIFVGICRQFFTKYSMHLGNLRIKSQNE